MSIKSRIKGIFQYYPKLNIQKIKNEIDKYEYVSFDVFDTLIKRDLYNPKDLFKFISLKNQKNDFYDDRIIAEKNARYKSNYEEITIDEIYEELNNIGKYSKSEIEILKKCELDFEDSIVTKNIMIYDIYKYCIEKNKKIIITTNSYLSKKNINNILMKNDYKEYYKLYVSSEVRLHKSNTLFKYILNDLNIQPEKIIHIGDSYYNDIKSCRKYKIKAIKIPQKIIISENNNNLYLRTLNSFINNRINPYNNEFYNFGYKKFGKVLYGFSIWLDEKLKENNIHDVYFLSRDGFLLKESFDVYNRSDIKTHYLEMSRRSTRVPMLWMDLSLENIIKTLPSATLTNIKIFFDSIGLEIDMYNDVLKSVELDEKFYIKKRDMLNNEKVKKLYDKIKEDIYINSKKEYDLLLEYLNKEISNQKIAFVDIGWRGSMQKFTETILKNNSSNIEIIGFYIGLSDEANIYSGQLKEYGYLFDCFNNKNDVDIRAPFVGLFESLFLHNSGSVKKYNKIGKKIIPEYYKNEYYDDNNKLNKSIEDILKIQSGALNFVKDYNKNNISLIDNMDKKILIKDIYNVGINPTKKDIEMFANLDFFDGEISKLANPKSFFYYILKPKKLIKDFYESRWKIGFMKKLFKIKFPYLKVYDCLKKNRKK